MSDYKELIKFGRRYALYQEDGDHSDFPEKAAAAIKTLLRERDEAREHALRAAERERDAVRIISEQRDEAVKLAEHRARAKAIEEAAGMTKGWLNRAGWGWGADQLSAAILALKDKP
jgi:hypothetical protein